MLKHLLRDLFSVAGWLCICAGAGLFALGAAFFGEHGYSAALLLSVLMAMLSVFCFACRSEIQDLIDLDDKT